MDNETGQITCQREKYWLEIDTVEKCKRLREKVLFLQNTVEAMAEKLSKMERHEHGAQGKLMVAYEDRAHGSGTTGGRNRQGLGDDVYF